VSWAATANVFFLKTTDGRQNGALFKVANRGSDLAAER
jgi:hypothetical protein